MQKSIEEVFLLTKQGLEKILVDAAKEAIDNIYEHYLPFVGQDTDNNVYFMAHDLLNRFFNDTLREDERMHPMFENYSGKAARAKVLEENKGLLKSLIIQDLQQEIEELKGSLMAARSWHY
jgi:hypothetical protein